MSVKEIDGCPSRGKIAVNRHLHLCVLVEDNFVDGVESYSVFSCQGRTFNAIKNEYCNLYVHTTPEYCLTVNNFFLVMALRVFPCFHFTGKKSGKNFNVWPGHHHKRPREYFL